MSELTTALCSICTTKRRRYLWAVWWTGAPKYAPFRQPDAAHGGARSEAEARAAAERVAGRHLLTIDPYWAHAWNRVLRGERPPPPPEARPKSAPAPSPNAPRSSRQVLGLAEGASLGEIKRAYRQRALETHPDRGGSAEAFREVTHAYERLLARAARAPRRRKP